VKKAKPALLAGGNLQKLMVGWIRQASKLQGWVP